MKTTNYQEGDTQYQKIINICKSLQHVFHGEEHERSKLADQKKPSLIHNRVYGS